jgi:hypothetical protein
MKMRMMPLLIISTVGCSMHRYVGPDMITSDSPCVDGTVVNMDAAGCDLFYWGTVPLQGMLKIRCTTSRKDNFWTTSTFYAFPRDDTSVHAGWHRHCDDRYVNMFYVTREEREIETE